MLLQLLSKHPDEARVHYLLGNLEFVERKPGGGAGGLRARRCTWTPACAATPPCC